ncbi:MAG TPA: CARDB domain-containing protein [Vitreimonas sp.]|nr:CARDB domain-containing protein [Vitreimonas sp.]
MNETPAQFDPNVLHQFSAHGVDHPSRSSSPAPASDQVNPKFLMGVIGALIIIPLSLLILNYGVYGNVSPETEIVVVTPSPSPKSDSTLGNLLSPLPTPKPSPSPSPSPKPSPSLKPSPSPTPKPSSSPQPSGSPTPSASPAGTNTTVDLSVDEIVIEDPTSGSTLSAPFYAGQRVTLRAKLRNNGKQDSGTFTSNWSINGSTQGSNTTGKVKAESQAVYDDVNSIVYGGFFLNQGDNNFTYNVDTTNALQEANRNNNSRTLSLKAEGTRSDVEAISIEFYQQGTTTLVDNPTKDQKLTAKATIKNNGQDKQGKFSLKWFINGSEVKHVTIDNWISPGATAQESTGYDFTVASGKTDVKFELNTSNQFPETNTGNNSKTRTISL